MCCLAASNVWLLFKGASWDVKKSKLGQAAARASQEDERGALAPVTPLTHPEALRLNVTSVVKIGVLPIPPPKKLFFSPWIKKKKKKL